MGFGTGGLLPDGLATKRKFCERLSNIAIQNIRLSLRAEDTHHGSRHEFELELVEHARVAALKRGLEVAEKHALFRRRVAFDSEYKRYYEGRVVKKNGKYQPRGSLSIDYQMEIMPAVGHAALARRWAKDEAGVDINI